MLRLVQKQANIAEIRTTFDDPVVVHACLIHDVYRSADDETYALRILERFLDYWQLKLVEELTTLVLLLFGVEVLVLTIENDLSLEIGGAVFEQVLKQFIFQLIDRVQH
mgnify:CR=1 FL=1